MCVCEHASVKGIYRSLTNSQSRLINVSLLSKLRVIKAKTVIWLDLNLHNSAYRSWIEVCSETWGAEIVTSSEMLQDCLSKLWNIDTEALRSTWMRSLEGWKAKLSWLILLIAVGVLKTPRDLYRIVSVAFTSDSRSECTRLEFYPGWAILARGFLKFSSSMSCSSPFITIVTYRPVTN